MKSEIKITECGTWNDRLEMLGYDIIALISNGKTEDIECIISQLEAENVVHYLMDKYKGDMFLINSSCPYNLDDWEKVLGQYAYISYGHDARRKMGLINQEKDGLLMLLNIIIQEVSDRRYA